MEFLDEMNKIKEDIPVNNVGQGNISGAGIGSKGEPGVNKKRKIIPFLAYIRRKDVNK